MALPRKQINAAKSQNHQKKRGKKNLPNIYYNKFKLTNLISYANIYYSKEKILVRIHLNYHFLY